MDSIVTRNFGLREISKKDSYACEYRDNGECQFASELYESAKKGDEDANNALDEFCASGLKYNCEIRRKLKAEQA